MAGEREGSLQQKERPISPIQIASSRRGRFAALLAVAAGVVAVGAWCTDSSGNSGDKSTVTPTVSPTTNH